MDIYAVKSPGEAVRGNSYVGRGIIIGKTQNGEKACCAYFIMGRSRNSRNRVFEEQDGVLYTKAFDPSQLEDPSLIIYAAMRRFENRLIVSNGDQTDTIYKMISHGGTFRGALRNREFEPDAPNYTPRISGILEFSDDNFSYEMSILKSADENGTACSRFNFTYPSLSGVGHFIHTYVCDGEPIPTFQGEPERVSISDSIDAFTDDLWNNLDEENRISLYVRYIDLKTGKEEKRLINKNV